MTIDMHSWERKHEGPHRKYTACLGCLLESRKQCDALEAAMGVIIKIVEDYEGNLIPQLVGIERIARAAIS